MQLIIDCSVRVVVHRLFSVVYLGLVRPFVGPLGHHSDLLKHNME